MLGFYTHPRLLRSFFKENWFCQGKLLLGNIHDQNFLVYQFVQMLLWDQSITDLLVFKKGMINPCQSNLFLL